MSPATPVYSTLFHCLYDEQYPKTRRFPHYSIFRAIDSRDVRQQPTARPRVHDFAVIWDDDHDTRIIPVLEEMLMAGVLPGIQFIGEHKGTLTIILAAATYYDTDLTFFTDKVEKLSAAAGDRWQVEVGMFDRTEGNLKVMHQCDFQSIVGGYDADHAFLFTIDSMWSLGTKEWQCVGEPKPKPSEGQFWGSPASERCYVDKSALRTPMRLPVPAVFASSNTIEPGSERGFPPLPKP
jgi:hypothetical protein